MSAKIKEIEEMSIDEVIENHDRESMNTVVGVDFWLGIYNNKKNELLIEEQRKLNKQMLLYTKAMTIMTVIVVIATIVSLVMTIIK
jgi:hypothetical protein